VIGSAGTDTKVQVLEKELGFTHGINYKTNRDIGKTLKQLAPEGFDVYFDGVSSFYYEA